VEAPIDAVNSGDKYRHMGGAVPTINPCDRTTDAPPPPASRHRKAVAQEQVGISYVLYHIEIYTTMEINNISKFSCQPLVHHLIRYL